MNRKVVHKVFWAWGFEREERWLNDMAACGWNLVDTTGVRYVFEQGTPGEYRYKLELLENLPSTAESERYLRFMEDAGIQQVAACGRWVYFRRRAEDGPFDLFSDLDSRIAHLRRIRTLLFTVIGVEVIAIMLQLVAFGHVDAPAFKQAMGPVLSQGDALFLVIAAILLVLLAVMVVQTVRVACHIDRLKKERAIRE